MSYTTALRIRLRTTSGSGVVVQGSRLLDPATPHVDASFDLGEGSLAPGLINAHDHLHRNHYPRLGSPPYANAYRWGEDIHHHFGDEIARAKTLPRRDALLFGALKNLIAGVTTVVHHDGWEPDFDSAFPIRVAHVRVAHSLRLPPRLADVASARGNGPLCVHLAEGVDTASTAEVEEAAAAGWLGPDVLAVHAVGVDEPGVAVLRRAETCVVWCPTSNQFLFERTAPSVLLQSVDVVLGTDALLTGEGTLLDELRAARRLGYLDDRRLKESVGATAAARLNLPPPTLSPGAPADLVLLRRSIWEATPRDVGLVLVDGIPRFGDAEFAELFTLQRLPCEALTVGGRAKLISAPLGAAATRVGDLFAAPLRILD